ncbi:MAG: penicillin-binding protein 2, partial [Candidatus Eisenbacteria bacterium]|nr:penicillin-binding protein 2 [Candidatus Latescibacterota bacterium]MBD3302613.1 penicillin-binding protein 2 [Candidatus Eisenbacteria bacterium]
VRAEPARRYPHGSLAAHLIGYVGEVSEEEIARGIGERPYRRKDLIGRTGVEAAYEEELRGIDGIETVGIDALGRRTNLFGELPSTPAIRGNDLLLTIDLDLQRAAEQALDSVPSWLEPDLAEPPGPRPGALVALDPRNGEILAMASRPTFDPNRFVRGLSAEQWRRLSGAGFPLLNRAIQSSYPPGSTFKTITALAGLEIGGIDPTRPMPRSCIGYLPFGNRRFRCWKRQGHGSLALRAAIVQSCDVYFYQLGMLLGTERMMDYAGACSLGAPTRIDLPQERTSLIPTVEWYLRERGARPVPGAALNLSIGQGDLLLTPLALARSMAAIATDGSLHVPRVVRGVLGRDARTVPVLSDEPVTIGRVPASDAHLRVVRDALEGVVMDLRGTGKRARVGSIRVAGKTGTAQNPHGDDHALFFGYAPAEAPEILVVVVLERSGHGGAIAAPVAQRVLEAALAPGPTSASAGGGG